MKGRSEFASNRRAPTLGQATKLRVTRPGYEFSSALQVAEVQLAQLRRDQRQVAFADLTDVNLRDVGGVEGRLTPFQGAGEGAGSPSSAARFGLVRTVPLMLRLTRFLSPLSHPSAFADMQPARAGIVQRMEQTPPQRRVIRLFPDYSRDYPLWENSTATWDVGATRRRLRPMA